MCFNKMDHIKKLVEGKPITKARLCARGFEEIQDFRNDSPCCSRMGTWSALSVLASNKWHLKSADFKTAFLHGKKIKREVYAKPKKPTATKSRGFRNVSRV